MGFLFRDAVLTPLKAAGAAVLLHPLMGRVIARVCRDRIPNVRTRDVVIDTADPEITPWIKTRIFWGAYESAEIRFVRQYIEGDLDVVELGASIGVVGCHIARRLAPGRRLILVEANPALLSQISFNLGRNAPNLNYEVVNAAIDYGDGAEVSLSLGSTNIDSSVRRGAGSGRVVSVPALTLSRLLRERNVGAYCLVCDIEGSEAALIERDHAALAKCRRLIIELHQTVLERRLVSVQEMIESLIHRHGFQLRARRGVVCVFDR